MPPCKLLGGGMKRYGYAKAMNTPQSTLIPATPSQPAVNTPQGALISAIPSQPAVNNPHSALILLFHPNLPWGLLSFLPHICPELQENALCPLAHRPAACPGAGEFPSLQIAGL